MTAATTNRRAHARTNFNTPVHCRFEANIIFPGVDQLAHSHWTCVDLGQGGMLLEAREAGGHDAQYFERVQSSFFTKGKPQGRIYYPALPPERLQVSVEIKFSRKRNSFIFHGILAWFRHVSKGIYRMGVRFEEGQDIHIYPDKNGQLVITALWRESDLKP